MWNALSYYWIAARGFRFHPWDSPYLRWRLETFLGAEQMQNFVDWAAERRRIQARSGGHTS
jgi:hypothetical protein